MDPIGDSDLARMLDGHDTTTIIIARRPATIRRAHHIAVLQNGTVVEQGTWDTLPSTGRTLPRLLANSAGAPRA